MDEIKKIDPTTKAFGTILLLAARYCATHRILSPKPVLEFISSILHLLPDRTVKLLLDEFRLHDMRGTEFGLPMDAEVWAEYRRALEREEEVRGMVGKK